MRIAWFTPWSRRIPLRSSVISAATVVALANPESERSARWDIELFLADDDLRELEAGDAFRGIRRFHYLRAADRHRTAPFDLFIYNIEDHPRCRFIAEFHHTIPGIVLAHDVNLNRLVAARFAHTTAPTEINQEMDELFGADSARLGDAFVRGWPLQSFDRVYRRGAAQLERAQRLILSDAYLRRSLSATTDARTTLIGYPLECFAVPAAPSGDIVIAADALAHPQVLTSLRALELLGDRLTGRRVLCLQSRDEKDVLATSSSAPIEYCIAATTEEYQRAIAAASLVIVPGVDEHRGLSFAAATALASGRPTILSPLGCGEGIPSQVALKPERLYLDAAVPVGHIDDAVLLSKSIAAVLESPALAATLSANARSWIAVERSVAGFCAQLRQLVEEESASLKLNRRVTERRYLTAQALHVHALMERLEAADLWKEGEESSAVLFNSVLKNAIRDFEWLEAPLTNGGS